MVCVFFVVLRRSVEARDHSVQILLLLLLQSAGILRPTPTTRLLLLSCALCETTRVKVDQVEKKREVAKDLALRVTDYISPGTTTHTLKRFSQTVCIAGVYLSLLYELSKRDLGERC